MDLPFQDGIFSTAALQSSKRSISISVFDFKVMGCEISEGCPGEPGIWWPMSCQGQNICSATGSVNFVYFFKSL